MSAMNCSLFSLGCVFGFPSHMHSNLTALRALYIAKRRLRPEVRSKLLSIYSARTDDTLAPQAWRFVFLDHATSGHLRAVTVAAKASSEHPVTVDAFRYIPSKSVSFSALAPIPQNELLVDSDLALERVREKSKLKGNLSAEYQLLQPRNNGRQAMWHLSLYAKSKRPIARFEVDAKTGAIQLSENDITAS